jgi:hypothetical protein
VGALLFFITPFCYAQPVLETDDLSLSMHTYLRNDLVTFKNVVDLDNKNKDDSTTYLGIDYSLGFNLDIKNEGPKFYLKLERNGPFDYDAPLFIHNTLMTSGGAIKKYRNEELLPELEEFWMDTPLFNPFRLKLGLYSYIVGNGFSLNGGYENLGFTISRESQDFCWRFYYCRPDLNHKYRLGPRIQQEKEQGILYEPNAANFFATDAQFKIGENSFQPYIGTLVDYTSAGKRDNIFSAAIKRDILGTIGLAWDRKLSNLTFNFEAANNFGKAESSDPESKDIYHTGYLIYAGLNYKAGKFNPSLSFLVCSGNKVTLDSAASLDETLTSAKNRAFSYYSPLNKNLGDAISSYNADMLPIVAMGGGYGLNYGVPRPKTFSAGDFDNLIMPCIGFDFQATKKLSLCLYEYYLSAFQRGAGTFEGEAKYLSRDLGFETDLFIDYKINQNILISLLGGYFLPGKFYKEKRGDTEGSLLTPFVRGDGNADPAYQVELALEFQF